MDTHAPLHACPGMEVELPATTLGSTEVVKLDPLRLMGKMLWYNSYDEVMELEWQFLERQGLVEASRQLKAAAEESSYKKQRRSKNESDQAGPAGRTVCTRRCDRCDAPGEPAEPQLQHLRSLDCQVHQTHSGQGLDRGHQEARVRMLPAPSVCMSPSSSLRCECR